MILDRPDGKIDPEGLSEMVKRELVIGDNMRLSPKSSRSLKPQSLGFSIPSREIKAISKVCREFEMLLHMDGCRIAHAAAAMGQSFKAMTSDAGVDLLSFGGTKKWPDVWRSSRRSFDPSIVKCLKTDSFQPIFGSQMP